MTFDMQKLMGHLDKNLSTNGWDTPPSPTLYYCMHAGKCIQNNIYYVFMT